MRTPRFTTAEQVGVTPQDMFSLLDSRISIWELLTFLCANAAGVQVILCKVTLIRFRFEAHENQFGHVPEPGFGTAVSSWLPPSQNWPYTSDDRAIAVAHAHAGDGCNIVFFVHLIDRKSLFLSKISQTNLQPFNLQLLDSAQ